MTLTVTTSKQIYNGDGSTTAFSSVFIADAQASCKAILTDSGGVSTTLVNPTHFSISGSFPGVVTYNMVTAPAVGETLTVYREVSATQETDYVENDDFPASSHEEALDKLTMLIQQVQEETDRALQMPISSTLDVELPDAVADKLLGWNSSATNLENKTAADLSLIVVSAFMETLLNDSTALEARTTLGVPIVGEIRQGFWSTLSDHILMYGETIGQVGSGADLESADYEDLFTHLWNSLADAQAPVSTGRGASAAADWAAGKTITVPDMRGRLMAGVDNMGGSSANRMTDAAADTRGGVQGVEEVTLTAAQSGLPEHTHSGGEASSKNHPTGPDANNSWYGSASATGGVTGGAQNASAAHTNVQPTMFVNTFIRYQ